MPRANTYLVIDVVIKDLVLWARINIDIYVIIYVGSISTIHYMDKADPLHVMVIGQINPLVCMYRFE